MVKYRGLMPVGDSGVSMFLGSKSGEYTKLGGKAVSSAVQLGNKISEYSHLILDNPVADVALGALAPEVLVGAKAGLNLLDKGLSVANPASRVVEGVMKKSGVNPLR